MFDGRKIKSESCPNAAIFAAMFFEYTQFRVSLNNANSDISVKFESDPSWMRELGITNLDHWCQLVKETILLSVRNRESVEVIPVDFPEGFSTEECFIVAV